MAGRILKITLEDTHPPIWRRVIVPDQITFRDLHEIIQVLFGWEGYHLHSFENYKHGFMVDCMEEPQPYSEYEEDKLLIDEYIEQLPWIRYTYDFGDDWNHKIVYEKTDLSYDLRYATLIKYKGDNPMEDSGGVGEWMLLTDFDPIDTSIKLEALEIPKRKAPRTKVAKQKKRGGIPSEEELMEAMLSLFLERTRNEFPELRDATNDDIMEMMTEALGEIAENGDLFNQGITFSDHVIQEQMDLLESGKSITIVQGKKKLYKYLEDMEAGTLEDYLKYSRVKVDRHQKPAVVFADHILGHVNELFYFFEQDEMKELLKFWDRYQSGQVSLEDECLDGITKGVCLGLIKLTGKRKIKLELCAEFEQVMHMIQREKMDSIYAQQDADRHMIGTILMAYTALTFDQFYHIYSQHSKSPMDKIEFERFVYWNGTMNQALTTFYNEMTGERYLTLPDMTKYLGELEERKFSLYFKVEPRSISEFEMKKWSQGINSAIPEWDQFFINLEGDDEEMVQLFFESYIRIAAGITMTKLIQNDLYFFEIDTDHELDESEMLALESDTWHHFAELCLVTPIIGLNGYSREQYAETFQEPLDYVPLFEESTLKKRMAKDTHIYEFPKDIQLEMLSALRSGEDEYLRVIRRLSQKYKTNRALRMELATITSDMIEERNPEIEDMMDSQNIIYPWAMEDLNIPKPETFVRETKKIGRNDPCPCGSGRKYKYCCGKA